MSRKVHRQVHEQLTEWADSAPPLPNPALAQFMGPVRPQPAASGRAMRAAVRTGLGIKVFGLLLTGFAISQGSPFWFDPQHFTVPPPKRAQYPSTSLTSDVAPVSPTTGAGTGARSPLVPVPVSP